MKDEVDKEIKRCMFTLILVVVLFSLGYLFVKCSSNVMVFKSKGIYPIEDLDSVCSANRLPGISAWRKSCFKLDTGYSLVRYSLVDDDRVITIDVLDSVFVFHDRVVE